MHLHPELITALFAERERELRRHVKRPRRRED